MAFLLIKVNFSSVHCKQATTAKQKKCRFGKADALSEPTRFIFTISVAVILVIRHYRAFFARHKVGSRESHTLKTHEFPSNKRVHLGAKQCFFTAYYRKLIVIQRNESVLADYTVAVRFPFKYIAKFFAVDFFAI